MILLISKSNAQQRSDLYRELYSRLPLMKVELGLKLLRTTGERRDSSGTSTKGKNKRISDEVLDAMIAREAQIGDVDQNDTEAMLVAQVQTHLSKRTQSGVGKVTRRRPAFKITTSVSVEVMDAEAAEEEKRRDEIRDIVDNKLSDKLSEASRKGLKAALRGNRDWFFQPQTMR